MRSYLLAFVVWSVCTAGLCDPHVYQRFGTIGNFVCGITYFARGSQDQIAKALAVSRRVLRPNNIKAGRLYLPTAYALVELGQGEYELGLGTLMFVPWMSRDFSQIAVLEQSDELLKAFAVELSASSVEDKQ